MRFMLAPRSANARHSSIPGNLQGMRNLPGSPSFLGNLLRMTAEKGGKKKSAAKADQSKKPTIAKQPKPVSFKQSKLAPAKQPKLVKEKSTKPSPVKKAAKAPKPQVEDEEYDLQRGIQMSLESFQALSQAPVSGVAFSEPASELQTPKKTSTTDQYIFQRRITMTKEASTGPSIQPEDDTSANIVYDTLSPIDVETGAESDKTNSEGDTEILNIGEEQKEDVANKVNPEEKTIEIKEMLSRS
uniref:Uncharacterized protein n=1 Tax=Tanacetum cinerariifolium TaxID=118510 RepID=A0A6L2K755_TANCI|nr:hypothetical protein [Tanacetum cinerariifolium]